MSNFLSEVVQINVAREMTKYIHLHDIFVLIYLSFILTSFVYCGVFKNK